VWYTVPMSILTGEILACDICGHRWLRAGDHLPGRCPSRKCRSALWHHGVSRYKESDYQGAVFCLDCDVYWTKSLVNRPSLCPSCGSERWAIYSREERRAHAAVLRAIKTGRLIRQPCEKCGKEKAVAHHEDYSKPLDVVWLCGSHHTARHWEIKREAKAMERDAVLAMNTKAN